MSGNFSEKIFKLIEAEIQFICNAHRGVGLDGYMRLYSIVGQEPLRVKEEGHSFWFAFDEIDKAIAEIKNYYNAGNLPNTPLMLDPIVYEPDETGNPVARGSGIMWATALAAGSEKLDDLVIKRYSDIGVFASHFARGESKESGVKVIALSDVLLKPIDDANTEVEGNLELFNLSGAKTDSYRKFYMLSGLEYLTKNGAYIHELFAEIFPEKKIPSITEADGFRIPSKKLLDANKCWQSYDSNPSLFNRFGNDIDNLESNLKLYELCSRDFELFDRTGGIRVDANEKFEFLVEGWIPKGAVTVIGATGGTGKSSLAHYLAVIAATDGDNRKWLDKNVNPENSKGLVVYFSGEDGAAIINARNELYDPEGKANRLMFLSTDYMGEENFSQFIKNRLMKLPDVSLVVIDPARKYLTGDEEDAGVVSEFFEAIEEFALKKKASVVIVHHLVKSAKPDNVYDILDLLRGSQVFIDRPRVVLGMYRKGESTMVGLAKNNIPPNLGMVQGEIEFSRDPKTLTLGTVS